MTTPILVKETLSLAESDFDFAMEVQDAMVEAELEITNTARRAVIYADCEMRLIETHYCGDKEHAKLFAVGLSLLHPDGQVYIVGGDVLD